MTLTGMLAAAGTGFGIFLAGRDDLLHTFSGGPGGEQVALSTAFAANLLPSLAMGVAATLLSWLVLSRLLPRLRRSASPVEPRAIAAALTPLALLGLAGLRYSPAVAALSPPLFLLVSTMFPFFASLVFLAVAQSVCAMVFRPADTPVLTGAREEVTQRWTPWLLFGGFALVIGCSMPFLVDRTAFAGDQPHYLLVTHSLLEDGDIYFDDDYASGVWRNFTTVSRLHPQARIRTVDGRVAPFHRIGVAVLAVPFYALGGRNGAVLLITLFAALGAAVLYRLTRKLGIGHGPALFASLWACLSLPMLSLSIRFMTDLPLSVLTLLALDFAWSGKEGRARPWLALLLAWTLPWIHARGLVLGTVLTLFIIWRERRNPRRALLIFLVALPLAATISLFNHALYGDFSPVAEMGPGQATDLKIANVVFHAIATLFDAGFGVLPFNPAVLLALWGLIALWKRDREMTVMVVLLAGAGLGPAMAFNHWWGGLGTPNRYASSVMYLLALPLAAFVAERAGRWLRGIAPYLVGLSIGLGIFQILNPVWFGNSRAAHPRFLEAFSAGPLRAESWWPYWFSAANPFWLHLLYFVCAIAAGAAILLALARTWQRLSLSDGTKTGLQPLVLFAAAIPLFVLFAGVSERLFRIDPDLRRINTIRENDSFVYRTRLGAFDIVRVAGPKGEVLSPAFGFSARRLVERGRLGVDEKNRVAYLPLDPGAHLLDIPPVIQVFGGSWRLDLDCAADSGEAQVAVRVLDPWALTDDQTLAQRDETVSAERRQVPIGFSATDTLAGVRVAVVTDRRLRLYGGTLRPQRLTDARESGLPADAADAPALRGTGYTLFLRTGRVFPPEDGGFWLPGDYRGDWLVRTDAATRELDIQLQAPPGIEVTLESQGRIHRWSAEKKAGSTRVTLPLREPDGLTDVVVRVRGGFVPAEREPGSQDRRTLGAKVRLSVR